VDPLTVSAPVAPRTLKFSPSFGSCPVEEGEEVFRNGIFGFNVTRLMAFIEAHPDRFPREAVEVASVPNYGGDEHLDLATIATADLARRVLIAEIAPGRFNLIDGNHRMARVRRDGVLALPAHRIHCPEHVAFLTSLMAEIMDFELPRALDQNGDAAIGVPRSPVPAVVPVAARLIWQLRAVASSDRHMDRPSWVTNEPEWLADRHDIVRCAQALVEGRAGIIELTRTLYRLGFKVRAHDDPDFRRFAGIYSESDALPVGQERKNWAPTALEREEPNIVAFELRWRDLAIESA